MHTLTYAEYHRMLGEWFATGRIQHQGQSLAVRQIAHEMQPKTRTIALRVYWVAGGMSEFAVLMTTQGGPPWTMPSVPSGRASVTS